VKLIVELILFIFPLTKFFVKQVAIKIIGSPNV
jgi:hypothetical protein